MTTNLVDVDTAEPEQRSVNDLLLLETYQGMSDAEIQSIIDYKVKDAINDQSLKIQIQSNLIQAEANAQALSDAATKNRETYKTMIEKLIAATKDIEYPYDDTLTYTCGEPQYV